MSNGRSYAISEMISSGKNRLDIYYDIPLLENVYIITIKRLLTGLYEHGFQICPVRSFFTLTQANLLPQRNREMPLPYPSSSGLTYDPSKGKAFSTIS